MLDRWLTIARLQFRALVNRRRLDADLDEELADHLARQTAANVAGGLAPDEARRAALAAFGGIQQQTEASRDARGLRWMEDLIQDARYGCRLWIREPRLTLAALLSLALATGANAAVFSLIDALLLRGLPVRQPGRLVLLTSGDPAGATWSRPVWDEIAARSGLFDGALAWAADRFDLTAGGPSAFADGVWISGSYFGVLGVSRAAGRLIGSDDDAPGAPAGPVAVISYRFWQGHFAGASDVIGHSLTINLSVRATRDAVDVKAIESAIVAVQPSLRLTSRSMAALIADTLSQERAIAVVAVTFGGLASLLAIVGLYGIAAFATVQRRVELAVRQALGARPAVIVGLVTGRMAILVLAGLALGIGATVWSSRFISSLLYGVAPQEPIMVASVAGGLAVVAAQASLIPVWRVTRGDMAQILRQT
jgi:hypothetical protein